MRLSRRGRKERGRKEGAEERRGKGEGKEREEKEEIYFRSEKQGGLNTPQEIETRYQHNE